MEYVNKLLAHPEYLKMLKELETLETERIYCKHDLDHCLHAARIVYILNWEYQLGISKQAIYLWGLLHDMGRIEEYRNHTSHEVAGVCIARKLLTEIDCPKDLTEYVIKQIASHRQVPAENEGITEENVFWYGDKKSRNCYVCPTADNCNWDMGKRTNKILW